MKFATIQRKAWEAAKKSVARGDDLIATVNAVRAAAPSLAKVRAEAIARDEHRRASMGKL